MKALSILLLASLGAAPGLLPAQRGEKAIVQEQLPSYPLDTCVISGEPLTAMGEPIDRVHEDRLVRFCCKGCIKQFEKDPAAALAKIDAAVVAAQKPSYPLETCPVSGEALGSMGDPIDHVHGTRLVRFCCKGCTKKFEAKPAKFMAVVDEALMRSQRESYPAKTCVVSGKPLADAENPHEILYGTRLVRFCCPMCEGKFREAPQKFLDELEG